MARWNGPTIGRVLMKAVHQWATMIAMAAVTHPGTRPMIPEDVAKKLWPAPVVRVFSTVLLLTR